MNASYLILAVVSILLAAQSTFSIILMLYIWEDSEKRDRNHAPTKFAHARVRFTILIPARHEETVIQQTIQRVVDLKYPPSLKQILVIIDAGDTGTIAKVREKLEELRRQRVHNVELITYDEPPINKPHGLNIGLAAATGDVVTIFDAEDEPHLDILNLANTIMRHEDVPVVQSGIQLMNYGDHWYSALNVLEYFFWFKSRMHYHATLGIVPLGGNTIFIRRDLIQELGGWDQSCLTEDADLGIRMSVAGVPIHVIYDDRYVTQEETPTTVSQFIRQRTRWDQGFLQVLLKWEWLHLPHWNQRGLAFYTLAFPFLQAITLVYFPISVWLMFFKKLPVLLAMISLLPLYALVIQFVVSILGLYEFTSTHEIRASRMSTVRMLVAFMPYQWLLGVAAVRAVWRQVLSVNTWEKTSHAGAHRPEHAPGGALPSLIRQNEENAIHD